MGYPIESFLKSKIANVSGIFGEVSVNKNGKKLRDFASTQ
jgi:hypothetical protein